MDEYQSDNDHTFRPRYPRVRVPLTLGLLAGLVTLGAVTVTGETAAQSASGTAQTVETTFAANVWEATEGQRSARLSALGYLQTGPLSRTSLVAQLEFDKHSAADARWAVDQLGVSWDAQAARSAASYLETMAFSRDGLIDQLVFEGFTREQAEYGADQAGL